MNQDRRTFLKTTTLATAAVPATAMAALSRVFAQITAAPSSGPPPRPDRAVEMRTLKERLSDKASDEQRVDNCRVPLERRGSTPRPGCPGEAEVPTPTIGQSATDPGELH
jgi:hypothetical protein